MEFCKSWIFVFLSFAFLDVFLQNVQAKIEDAEDCPRSKVISTFYPCHRSDGRIDRCVRKRCCAGYQYVNGHCVPEELDVCADTPCEQQCTNNFGRVLCTCYSGFMFDKTKYRAGLSPYCVDLDECRFRNGGCDQLCINTVGSYRCACNDGFKVAADWRSCIETPIVKSTGIELEEEVCHASCRNFTFLHTVVQDVENKLLLILQKENTKEISFKDPKIENFPTHREFKGFSGPPGEIGPPGAKGETGDQGGPGPAGPPGPQGLPGSQGPPGPAGLRGQKGALGFTGIEGKRGYRGARGHTGPIGDTGAKGERGADGLSGLRGQKGLKGRIGPPGVPGLPGIPGRTPTSSMTSKISEGKRGKRGPQGRTGPPGKPGQKGETGIPGPRGPKGESAIGEAVLNMIANLRRDIVELQQTVLGSKTSNFNTMNSGNNLGNTLLTTDDEDLTGSGRNPNNPS